VLKAFGVAETVAFFREIGVTLHEEEDGKLFPDANRSRVVLDALLGETRRQAIDLRAGERVLAVEAQTGGFRLLTSKGALDASRVVLATGGLSLPKTGSDGQGLSMARSLGHSVVPTTPALVPLLLGGALHARLCGVALDAELSVRAGSGGVLARRRGSLLWTHFGVSGPVVLDVSRAWLRAQLDDGRPPTLEASFVPGTPFEVLERQLLDRTSASPRLGVGRALTAHVPAAVAEAFAEDAGVARDAPLGRLRREERRAIVAGLVARRLGVEGSRGYAFAEATAGGVPLAEVDTRTMESRVRPGLFLAGEMLDVDGRIGGFNFQWAWSSAWVTAGGLAGGALW
jgi:predicted Rossmann fold flavoprotein